MLDVAQRKLKSKKWAIFAVWWRFVSDINNSNPTKRAYYKSLLDQYRQEAKVLDRLISAYPTGLKFRINSIVEGSPGILMPPEVKARSVPQPTYFQRRDPTLCIAGMDSGWPTEYLGFVTIRFANELREGPQAFDPGPLNEIQTGLLAMSFLLKEAFDTQSHSNLLGFTQWKEQPWRPLYIEWEATYYDIPMKEWSVEMLNSPIDINHAQVRYGIKKVLADDELIGVDQRTIGGRTIVLPQPVVNLKALVEQVLTDPSVELTGEEITNLKNNIDKLKFSTAELSGLTTNLLTLSEGTHVQPNFEDPGVGNSSLVAAVIAAADIGFTTEDCVLIGEETALTPYGAMKDFSQSSYQPFKGITHGQFRFTKLNIIDKFGQVVSAIPPEAPLTSRETLRNTIYPCLGDQVCPGVIPGTNHLNTVFDLTEFDRNQPGAYPLCPYIQLDPAINQDARLNASFLVPQLNSLLQFSGWRHADEWESPVFAWIIVNYADYSLQFFTGEGVFFVEMALGGPEGTIKSPEWRPFDPPQSTVVSPQLTSLINKMTDPTNGPIYLRSFWDMITSSIEHMPFTPGDYAAYATSIVGKPLALINAGCSLELALPPLESQISKAQQPVISGPSAAEILYSHKFPVKIGDKERFFDGVVGYFDTENISTVSTNFDKLHSYFAADGTPEAGDPRVGISPSNFETLSPYYIDPEPASLIGKFRAAHASKLTIKTMIIDPYTSLHLYTPILPIKSFKLPPWTVQSALQKMSAFFRVGPVLHTTNIPTEYDATKAVNADTWAAKQQDYTISPDAPVIQLPIGGGAKGQWNWLQPYVTDEATGKRQYNAFDIGEEDGRMRLDPGPYTLVEGFLQLMQPLRKEDLQ